MAPLIVLLVSFGIVFLIDRFILHRRLGLGFIGRLSMAVMLIVTGIAHFTNTAEMIEMMPDLLPAKREIVYFTGICELLAVVGLLWDKTAKLTAVLLMIFFLAVLPANIAGSLKAVNFGGMEYGAWYLAFRIPLQIFLIWWAWYFGIRRASR